MRSRASVGGGGCPGSKCLPVLAAMGKSIRITVRLTVKRYVALVRQASREGCRVSDIVRRALGDSSDGSMADTSVSDNGVSHVDDEVEGRNPLEYVRVVREELERRARQHAGAKRW